MYHTYGLSRSKLGVLEYWDARCSRTLKRSKAGSNPRVCSRGSWPSLVYALLCGGSRYKRGFTVRQLVRTIFTDHYRWLRSPPTSLLRRTTLDQPCLNLGSVLVLRGVPTVYWMGAHQSPLPVGTGLSLSLSCRF